MDSDSSEDIKRTMCFGRKKGKKDKRIENKDVNNNEKSTSQSDGTKKNKKTPEIEDKKGKTPEADTNSKKNRKTPDVEPHSEPVSKRDKKGTKTPDSAKHDPGPSSRTTPQPTDSSGGKKGGRSGQNSGGASPSQKGSKNSKTRSSSEPANKPVPITVHENVGFPQTLQPQKDKKGNVFFTLPANWDSLLNKNYARGIWNVKLNGQPGICVTIHLNDYEPATKRHFLSFYGIPVHRLKQEEFQQWCYDASMFNTVQEYHILSEISEHQGPGSLILRSLYYKPGVLGVELSDRFLCGKGMVRAVRFTAITRRQAVNMCNLFLQSIKPSMVITTIVGEQYPEIETDDPIGFQNALKQKRCNSKQQQQQRAR